MRAPSRSDLALVVVFCVALPLAAGGWWRYFSGYDHPQVSASVEQAPAAQAIEEHYEIETDVPLLAWTTSAATQDTLPAAAVASQPGEAEER